MVEWLIKWWKRNEAYRGWNWRDSRHASKVIYGRYVCIAHSIEDDCWVVAGHLHSVTRPTCERAMETAHEIAAMEAAIDA